MNNLPAELDEKIIAEQHPDLYSSLIPLLQRSEPDSLDAFLETASCNVAIENTRTQAHCHFIALDGNKRPRVKDFARFLGNKITDFAIPRNEIQRALNDSIRLNSASPIAEINTKARKLFTRLPNSGEGGEVILSVLAETFLSLPQIFTKMVLKTNTQMHIHGSDGIHISVNESNGNLALYWGESKLYGDPAAAVRECFASLAPFLNDTGGSDGTQERDLQLMREGLALNDAQLENALKQYLDPNNPLFKQLEYRGLCLVGCDTDKYPTQANSTEMELLKQNIVDFFESRKKHIGDRIVEETIHCFDIQMFFLPFPSVDEFRTAFRSELGLTNEQS
ncbi:MAG: DUF1837 domain-containing protein [Phycisphaerae bacterium]|nr:DUF1837 domain-containing protein [Phycisphaerae bacterium]